MIRRSDVVRIKMPFPDISSDLAVNSHMYICHSANGNTFHYISNHIKERDLLSLNPLISVIS